MNSEKINVTILKLIIYAIAKNNGAPLSHLEKIKKLKAEAVDEQLIVLKNLGLLDFESPQLIKFKQGHETLQKIANILDNKELSRFMRTQFYKDNLKSYCTRVLDSFNEDKLYPLPEVGYIEYALKNSPSTVRFFLVDNEIKAFKSFYQRCISSTNEKVKDKIKIQLFEEYQMYLIWDNVIFGKVQEDLQKKILLDPVNYYAGYLPLAKITFDKLLELYNMVEKEEKDKNLSSSKLKKYLKSLKSIKHVGLF